MKASENKIFLYLCVELLHEWTDLRRRGGQCCSLVRVELLTLD